MLSEVLCQRIPARQILPTQQSISNNSEVTTAHAHVRARLFIALWLCLKLQPGKCQENLTELSKQALEPWLRRRQTGGADSPRRLEPSRPHPRSPRDRGARPVNTQTHTLSPATCSPAVVCRWGEIQIHRRGENRS